MSVHILLDTTFFQTSVSIASQQRMLPVPANRGLNEGDTIFLRDESGTLTWVMDVLMTGEVHGVGAWSGAQDPAGRYAITGYLAKIHPGILPAGKSRLQSPWVTLNSRTLENALPWWETHVLLYHSTLHLIEGLLTLDEVTQGLKENCLVQHPSGHIVVPHGEARKRLLVNVQGVELQCSLCGGAIASIEEATQDHVIPLSQGGPDALANIELAHRECNELKGNALPEQYPPMFPTPGESNGWRPPHFRNGRHVHSRHGRRTTHSRRQTVDPSLPIRGTGAVAVKAERATATSSSATTRTNDAGESVFKSAKSTTTKEQATQGTKPKAAASERKAETSLPVQAPDAGRGTSDTKTNELTEKNEAKNGNGTVDVDPAWLERIQRCNWSELMQYAGERDWASKTASLRTLEQLPRSDIKEAQASGKLLVEAEGQKGRFRLLEWGSNIVLIEQRGNRHSYFLVKPLNAIGWETYVWYLANFGRTTPLAVAMALLPLWRQGRPDADGVIHVNKTGIPLSMHLRDDRLIVVEREESTDVA